MSNWGEQNRFAEGVPLVVGDVRRVHYLDDEIEQAGRLPVLPMNVTYAPPHKNLTDSQLFSEEPEQCEHHEKVAYYWPVFLVLVTIIDVIMMGVEIAVNHGFEPFSVNPFFGPSVSVLEEMGAKDGPEIKDHYQLWRLFVPIFLHAGLIHLAFNMLFQIQCIIIERRCGFFRVGIVYILSGIGGNILSCIFVPNIISVGASGALFGMVAMTVVMILVNWHYLWRPFLALVSILIMLAFSLAMGLLPMVDNWTHIGGFIIGFLCSVVIVPSMGRPYGFVRGVLALVCTVVTVAALGGGLWAILGDTLHFKSWCGDVCDKIDCYDFGQNWWNCTAYQSQS